MPAPTCRPSTLTGRRDGRLPHLRPVPHLRQRPINLGARLRWRRNLGLLRICAGFCRCQLFTMAACTHLAGIPQSVPAGVSELQCNPSFDSNFSALSQTNQSLEMSAACPQATRFPSWRPRHAFNPIKNRLRARRTRPNLALKPNIGALLLCTSCTTLLAPSSA